MLIARTEYDLDKPNYGGVGSLKRYFKSTERFTELYNWYRCYPDKEEYQLLKESYDKKKIKLKLVETDINKYMDGPQIEAKRIFDWHNDRIGNN